MTAHPRPKPDAKTELLEAAKRVLLEHGYAGLSTRAVAAEADTQMSQIRYHFGSKEGLVLALFEYLNAALIERQAATFHRDDLTVSRKWQLACDYLEEDLDSCYVRVLQELMAVGWSNPAVGAAVRAALAQWQAVIRRLIAEIDAQPGRLGPFTPEELMALVAAAFLGAETQILLGISERELPLRAALRRVGDVIVAAEGGG